MKKRKIIMLAILLLFVVSFLGYAFLRFFSDDSGKGDKEVDNIDFTITETKWWDGGSESKDIFFDEIKVDDVLYESDFGSIKVKKESDRQIVLFVEDGFVEKVGDGIDMQAEDLTEIKLDKGESIQIDSKSFDAGVTLTITFN